MSADGEVQSVSDNLGSLGIAAKSHRELDPHAFEVSKYTKHIIFRHNNKQYLLDKQVSFSGPRKLLMHHVEISTIIATE